MRLATTAEMHALEQGAVDRGVGLEELMDRAGAAVARAVQRLRAGRAGRALVLVGPGNNGGDGLVCAEQLRQAGWELALAAVPGRPRDTARFPILQHIQPGEVPYERVDVVVDALLGTGASRPLEGPLAALLNDVHRRQPSTPAVAVDVPTGVNADSGAADPRTLAARLTVSLGLAKPGLFQFPAQPLAGEVRVVDIGLPAELLMLARTWLSDAQLAGPMLPARPRDAHKGTFGKLLVVAGSPSYSGAPYLASAAAMRVGAGLVRLAVPASVQPLLASKFTEATFTSLPETGSGGLARAALPALEKLLDQAFDCLLIGPGLGQEVETVALVQELLLSGKRLPAAVVVDADGLNSLARVPDWFQRLPPGCVLTPHPAEFGRLAGLPAEEVVAGRFALARDRATAWGQVLLAKGANCIVAAPDGRIAIDPGATPLVATAGTGDVLAGTVAGLATQGLPAWEAAVAGTRLCSMASGALAPHFGDAGMLASDLHAQLPLALKALKAQAIDQARL